ncbi:hypothetical protein K449DRAFT_1762 [Hypoxylon sp. EC38]|nr:hypothetical protein K449DRAFT_1762 [Hypoxylon sp. EC38]
MRLRSGRCIYTRDAWFASLTRPIFPQRRIGLLAPKGTKSRIPTALGIGIGSYCSIFAERTVSGSHCINPLPVPNPLFLLFVRLRDAFTPEYSYICYSDTLPIKGCMAFTLAFVAFCSRSLSIPMRSLINSVCTLGRQEGLIGVSRHPGTNRHRSSSRVFYLRYGCLDTILLPSSSGSASESSSNYPHHPA